MRRLCLHRNFNFGRLRVAEDIGQGFLKDAEDGCRLRLIQREVFQRAVTLADDAGARLKLLRLPFNRCGQAEVVQHAGP